MHTPSVAFITNNEKPANINIHQFFCSIYAQLHYHRRYENGIQLNNIKMLQKNEYIMQYEKFMYGKIR